MKNLLIKKKLFKIKNNSLQSSQSNKIAQSEKKRKMSTFRPKQPPIPTPSTPKNFVPNRPSKKPKLLPKSPFPPTLANPMKPPSENTVIK
jgi:hypothetical protein